MKIKISDLLKNEGVFSKEIKARFQNNQIKLNGETVKDDIEFDIVESVPPIEAGEWIFTKLLSKLTEDRKKIFLFFVDLFGIDVMFSGDCQINNKPIEDILPELNEMKGHILLKTSKKQMFVLKLL